MADLLSHALLAHIVGRGRTAESVLPWLLTGSLLPDLVSPAPRHLLRLVAPRVGWSITDQGPLDVVFEGLLALHSPFPLLALTAALALALPARLVRPPGRWAVFGWTSLGCALHLLVDVTQRHPRPGYRLLYPFDDTAWELGWVTRDASLWALPVLFALSLLVERRFRKRRAAPDAGDGPAITSPPTQRDEA